MNRTVLISGASKGIGRALAERLATQGHKVIGIARTGDATFPVNYAPLTSRIGMRHRRHCGIFRQPLGSTRWSTTRVWSPQTLEEVTLDALDAVLDVNLRTAIQLTQAALPGMRQQGWGRVVNIASLVALGAVERTAYAAAKAALISSTRGWALELATTGITVNAVAPGPDRNRAVPREQPARHRG